MAAIEASVSMLTSAAHGSRRGRWGAFNRRAAQGLERNDIRMDGPRAVGVIAVVLKGYPRLSETFIAQELRALEERGLRLALYSMRHPTDRETHPVHAEIRAPVAYLPEYLHDEELGALTSTQVAQKMTKLGISLRNYRGEVKSYV